MKKKDDNTDDRIEADHNEVGDDDDDRIDPGHGKDEGSHGDKQLWTTKYVYGPDTAKWSDVESDE